MASLLSGYEYDIFISYRQKDNKYDGWVTEFVSNLKKELEATFKEDISIYFDENPHDGLRETHDVDSSLKEKLKCLIFIPIISQTYCDPKSFAWTNEFLAFLKTAGSDSYGLKTRLPGGNTASRVLPIRIHELDTHDKKLLETELQGPLRPIDFTYHSAGVNRPLRPKDDEGVKGQAQNTYRDQINKTANAIKDIILGLQGIQSGTTAAGASAGVESFAQTQGEPRPRKKWTLRIPDRVRRAGSNVPLILAVLAFIALAIIHFSERAPENRTYRYDIQSPENTSYFSSFGGHIALSPDGRLLAFVAKDSVDRTMLWVRPLNALTGMALSNTQGAEFPFWSPDSRFIGFFVDGKLKKIEATGGTAQTLCAAPSGRGGTWSATGTIVFCPSGGVEPLLRVSDAGGLPVAVTKLDSSRIVQSHRWPHFLPDGNHFLYLERTKGGVISEEDAIWLASLDSTFIPRPVTKASSSMAYANGKLFFVQEQALMAQPFDEDRLQTTGQAIQIVERVNIDPTTAKTTFTLSQNGILAYQTESENSSADLIWKDRNGKQTGIIPKRGYFENPRISPDGKKIVVSYRNAKSNMDIWIYEVSRDVWTRSTFDIAVDLASSWSPDGAAIVFASNRNRGVFKLYRRESSGAGTEELLLKSDTYQFPTDWSRDGRFIAYTEWSSTTTGDIWILPTSPDPKGGQKPFPFLQTPFFASRAVFSPDGRWIAYESNESGNVEVYIRPFPGPGGKWQVSKDGGQGARWRRDGKELFYLDTNFKMMAAEVSLGSATVDIGQVRTLFTVDRRDYYDVTADGQHFIIASWGVLQKSSQVKVVVNWPGEIK